MHTDASNSFPRALLDAILKIKQPFITPIYDFTAPSIAFEARPSEEKQPP
jgi:hypothetical protein